MQQRQQIFVTDERYCDLRVDFIQTYDHPSLQFAVNEMDMTVGSVLQEVVKVCSLSKINDNLLKLVAELVQDYNSSKNMMVGPLRLIEQMFGRFHFHFASLNERLLSAFKGFRFDVHRKQDLINQIQSQISQYQIQTYSRELIKDKPKTLQYCYQLLEATKAVCWDTNCPQVEEYYRHYISEYIINEFESNQAPAAIQQEDLQALASVANLPKILECSPNVPHDHFCCLTKINVHDRIPIGNVENCSGNVVVIEKGLQMKENLKRILEEMVGLINSEQSGGWVFCGLERKTLFYQAEGIKLTLKEANICRDMFNEQAGSLIYPKLKDKDSDSNPKQYHFDYIPVIGPGGSSRYLIRVHVNGDMRASPIPRMINNSFYRFDRNQDRLRSRRLDNECQKTQTDCNYRLLSQIYGNFRSDPKDSTAYFPEKNLAANYHYGKCAVVNAMDFNSGSILPQERAEIRGQYTVDFEANTEVKQGGQAIQGPEVIGNTMALDGKEFKHLSLIVIDNKQKSAFLKSMEEAKHVVHIEKRFNKLFSNIASKTQLIYHDEKFQNIKKSVDTFNKTSAKNVHLISVVPSLNIEKERRISFEELKDLEKSVRDYIEPNTQPSRPFQNEKVELFYSYDDKSHYLKVTKVIAAIYLYFLLKEQKKIDSKFKKVPANSQLIENSQDIGPGSDNRKSGSGGKDLNSEGYRSDKWNSGPVGLKNGGYREENTHESTYEADANYGGGDSSEYSFQQPIVNPVYWWDYFGNYHINGNYSPSKDQHGNYVDAEQAKKNDELYWAEYHKYKQQQYQLQQYQQQEFHQPTSQKQGYSEKLHKKSRNPHKNQRGRP